MNSYSEVIPWWEVSEGEGHQGEAESGSSMARSVLQHIATGAASVETPIVNQAPIMNVNQRRLLRDILRAWTCCRCSVNTMTEEEARRLEKEISHLPMMWGGALVLILDTGSFEHACPRSFRPDVPIKEMDEPLPARAANGHLM
eukprot:10817040-Heterocapsa_arctica.AAC.1